MNCAAYNGNARAASNAKARTSKYEWYFSEILHDERRAAKGLISLVS
ncbi:hypothetical protein D554_2052 [Bordetella holmesii 30539]|uniref:N-acetyltransferase YedL n=1 Tax=Bordetella holmesii 1058 TaxID=1247648 RepID=A0ABP3BJP3_9BORD|nr:hypothetical protein D556_0652 [Bordetella holmesii 41130]EWM50027.1 hypothetical protein D555_0658 [Bordetella holmesii 35009]EXF86802.1 hypothetical protein D554_2052 [Bordetella holmesii 30539]EXX95172.1 hypothetical protein D559_2602 [Bordetella holmesii 1058]